MPTTAYLIFFAANLAFIGAHLYGWLLKWYYKPKAYSEDFHALFRATGRWERFICCNCSNCRT